MSNLLPWLLFLLLRIVYGQGKLCAGGPGDITNIADLCNKSFADANATGFYSFNPNIRNFNNNTNNVTWAVTLSNIGNNVQTALWYNTGGADYSNDIAIIYDVCFMQINGLTPPAKYRGQNDDGSCSASLPDKCVTDLQDLAANRAGELVDNPPLGPDTNLTGNVPEVCNEIGKTVQDQFPKSCQNYFTSDASVLHGIPPFYVTPLTQYNHTNPAGACVSNPEHGCAIRNDKGTFWGVDGAYIDLAGNSEQKRKDSYDQLARNVYPALLVFMSVASTKRITSVPAKSFLSCLHPSHYNEGSRVPPPMKPPPGLNSGLSGGDIAGIVVGSVAGAAIIAGIVLWFFWRRRRNAKQTERPTELDGEARGAREMSVEHQKVEASAGDAAAELNPDAQKREELPGDMMHELPGDTGAVEAEGRTEPKEKKEDEDEVEDEVEDNAHDHPLPEQQRQEG